MADTQLAVEFGIEVEGHADWVERRPDGIDAETELRAFISLLEVGLQNYLSWWAAAVPQGLALARLYVDETDDQYLVATALGIATSDGRFSGAIEGRILPSLFEDLGFETELTGGTEQVARFDWDSGSIVLVLNDLRFRRGSAKVSAVIQGFVIPILAIVIAAPPAIGAHRDWELNTQIESTLNGSACRADVSFRVKIDSIRKANDQLLNWTETGIDAYEQQLRLCRVQFALKSMAFGPGKLDGHLGAQTEAALRSFARSKNISLPPVGAAPDELDTPQLRDALAHSLAAAFR